MKKIIILFLLVLLLLSCSEQRKNVEKTNPNNKDKNVLLLKTYKNNDYVKCLKILKNGADGRIDYLKPDSPLLFDIYQKYQKYLYSNDDKKRQELETLFNFYLKNRKAAFEDSIEGSFLDNIKKQLYPKQTVGSYLSRFASVELLRQIVREKINISSPYEKNNSAIFELSRTDTLIGSGTPIYSKFYNGLAVRGEEKKIRMELLLDAGADVTLIDDESGTTIFHYFGWSPFEEDYTELLDRMIEKGADLFKRDRDGDSCIKYAVGSFALKSNTEAYLEYVISRGLHATEEDMLYFISRWYKYIISDKITETELQRLKKIIKILEDDTKLTLTIKSVGGWEIR